VNSLPHIATWIHIDWILVIVAAWLLVGIAGLFALHRFRLVAQVLFPIGSALGLALFGVSMAAVFSGPQVAVLPLGLPGLPLHFRLDSLSAFFLMVTGGVSAGVSTFAAGYFRQDQVQGHAQGQGQGQAMPPGLLCLGFHGFLVSMVLVLLADDAYSFMVMWETMALSSYFLVTANHQSPETRSAGYLYLLMAHIGALSLLLCFGVLQADTGDYTFANMRAQDLSPFWASTAFLLAVFGYGAKAGVWPLHVWLPEAHPAAPSPVSALMSAVMLKTAVYGVLRVSFDLLHAQLWWWGGVLLAVGLATALFGVVFAAVQVDMKRLLAYSSIENIGLLFSGLGLTLIFAAYGMKSLAALALTASLYHVACHAWFKSLLFLGTGCVLHATAQRSMGKLGGLMRYMPWAAWLTLVGVLASAGLPPLGGFVSEWLLLQSFLFAPSLPNPFLDMLMPVAAALIALVAALAGFAMVKFFGIIFLGQPRDETLAQARDAGRPERVGMAWLALGSVALGLMPTQFLALIDPVTNQLVNSGLGHLAAPSGWLLIPTATERASYGPVIFLLGIAACCVLTYALVRRLYHGRVRRAPPWDCGFPWQTARMQDTAEGFGQPIRQIFEPLLRIERVVPSVFDTHPTYRASVEDPIWVGGYLPIARAVEWLSRLVGRLQRGRISVYLLFSFVTLVLTLILVKR